MIYPHQKIHAVVMFTDMAGYTALMHKNENEAIAQRARHKQAMRVSHEKYRGEIIQYFGDGTLSIFSSVADAIEAAIILQKSLRKAPEIPLRIGIHAGEVVRTEDDILGDGVNIASRIESFCPAGAIVFSSEVKAMLERHEQYRMISLGQFHLKNIDEPLKLYALEDDRVVVPIPGALTGKGFRLSGTSSSIPPAMSSFVGRDTEIRELKQLITGHRLITISGPGGTGKTRLSIEIARSLAEDAPSRVFWVNLAQVNEKEQVAFAIADALGVNQDPQFAMHKLVGSFIGEQELIVVLDNFEQVVEATPIVGYLLNQCPKLKFIITSRICLRLEAEVEYPVSPLKAPVQGTKYSVEEALTFPSVVLFNERAKKARHNFRLTTSNLEAVIAICNRVDGLPLAIELAAARAKVLSPEALMNRLEKSLELLKWNSGNLPSRHQTLRQTVMWSFDLLSHNEKDLFGQLSVFSGSFALEAAEIICDIPGDTENVVDIIELVVNLVDKSLVATIGNEEIRFYMLETIRAFAAELLAKAPNRGEIERRHAEFYLSLVQEARTHLTGYGQVKWLTILESDYANIRKALHWCYANEEYESAYQFGIALWRYWNNRSLLTEGLEEIQKILGLPISTEQKDLRLRMLEGLGVIYVNLNTFTAANEVFRETVEIWRNKNDEKQLGTILNHLGWTSINIGDFDAGEAASKEALEIHRKHNNIYGEGVSINNLAWIEFEKGQPVKAAELWSASGELRKRAKDLRGYGFSLANTAMAMADTGALAEAKTIVKQAIEIHEESKSNLMMYWDYMILINIYLSGNEIEECRALLEKIYAKGFNIGSYNVTVNYYMFKSQLLMIEGNHDEALSMAELGLQLGRQNGIDHCVRRIMVILAQNAMIAGWSDKALEYCMEGISACGKYGDLLRQIQLIEVRAGLHLVSGELEKAAVLYEYSIAKRDEAGAPRSPAENLVIDPRLAEVRNVLGDELFSISSRQGRSLDQDSVQTYL